MSVPEIELVAEHAPGARMAFMHPVKSRAAITRAYREFGVRTFALDTHEELAKILDATDRWATALKSIVDAGQPPADIIGNLAVPSGSTVVRTLNVDQGAGQYDRTVVLRTGLSSDEVGDLYRTLLPRLGWKVTDRGSPATGTATGTVILFKRGSSDSYYWEVGATVSPTTSTGSTTFSLEVFELPDDN